MDNKVSASASIKGSRIIVALDYDSQKSALDLASRLDPQLCRVKVGKELFTSAGPSVVESLQNKGFEVFLDLKFHDIPNTCAKAVKAASELGVWMVNVHASGGLNMMLAAKEALDKAQSRTILLGVTVLTSMSDEDLVQVGVNVSADEQVLKLAQLVNTSRLDGVVCSAQEAAMLKQTLGTEFVTVTPGIRPKGSSANDQTRITTPEQALTQGADYLVIGRPITQANDPLLVCQSIFDSISNL